MMVDQRPPQSILSPASQLYIDKLESKLRRRKLLDVLYQLPSSNSFLFQQTTIDNTDAVKVHLGDRRQSDGEKVAAYAYIWLGRGNIEPPVVFSDEFVGCKGELRSYPRSASSLLRKAQDLKEPFCFLQHYPGDQVKNICGILCSLVAYYALIAGVSDCAIRWYQFYPSLLDALDYVSVWVRTRTLVLDEPDDKTLSVDADEHIKISESCLVMKTTSALTNLLSETGTTERHPLQAVGGHEKQGGIVCAAGSSIEVGPDTSLGKIMKSFGPKIRSLDHLPKTPVTITRQSLYPTYWPYRLHIGTYQHNHPHGILSNVYVYYTQQNLPKPSMVIHADKDGEIIPCVFDGIREINLLEPFKRLMQPNWKSKNYEWMRVRYLVHYYFAVAAHGGLTEELPIDISCSAIQTFVKACNTFNQVGGNPPISETDNPSAKIHVYPLSRATRSKDDNAKESTIRKDSTEYQRTLDLHPKKEHTKTIVGRNKSLVVQLRVNRDLLTEVVRHTSSDNASTIPSVHSIPRSSTMIDSKSCIPNQRQHLGAPGNQSLVATKNTPRTHTRALAAMENPMHFNSLHQSFQGIYVPNSDISSVIWKSGIGYDRDQQQRLDAASQLSPSFFGEKVDNHHRISNPMNLRSNEEEADSVLGIDTEFKVEETLDVVKKHHEAKWSATRGVKRKMNQMQRDGVRNSVLRMENGNAWPRTSGRRSRTN